MNRQRSGHFWPVVVLGSFPVVFGIGAALRVATGEPALALTDDDTGRQAFYEAVSGAAGALLGFTITALAILIALPPTKTVERLRGYAGWPTLLELLLTEIVLTSVLLASGLAALLLDVSAEPREWVSRFVISAAISTGLGIVAVTVFFWLVVTIVGNSEDD